MAALRIGTAADAGGGEAAAEALGEEVGLESGDTEAAGIFTSGLGVADAEAEADADADADAAADADDEAEAVGAEGALVDSPNAPGITGIQ